MKKVRSTTTTFPRKVELTLIGLLLSVTMSEGLRVIPGKGAVRATGFEESVVITFAYGFLFCCLPECIRQGGSRIWFILRWCARYFRPPGNVIEREGGRYDLGPRRRVRFD